MQRIHCIQHLDAAAETLRTRAPELLPSGTPIAPPRGMTTLASDPLPIAFGPPPGFGVVLLALLVLALVGLVAALEYLIWPRLKRLWRREEPRLTRRVQIGVIEVLTLIGVLACLGWLGFQLVR